MQRVCPLPDQFADTQRRLRGVAPMSADEEREAREAAATSRAVRGMARRRAGRTTIVDAASPVSAADEPAPKRSRLLQDDEIGALDQDGNGGTEDVAALSADDSDDPKVTASLLRHTALGINRILQVRVFSDGFFTCH